MADVTLTSVPSGVDEQKVKKAVHETLESQQPLTQADLKRSMQEVADRISLGEFGHADPKQSFTLNVTATVSQTPSVVVNFTWSF